MTLYYFHIKMRPALRPSENVKYPTVGGQMN